MSRIFNFLLAACVVAFSAFGQTAFKAVTVNTNTGILGAGALGSGVKLTLNNGVVSNSTLSGTTIYGGAGSNDLSPGALYMLGLRGSAGQGVSVYPTAHTVNSIADLMATPTTLTTTNATVEVRGYYTAGDGGGGTFYYAPFEATNRGTVFQAGSASFVWKRVLQKGRVSVEMFGAKADDTTSDQTAIMAAAEYMNGLGGGDVEFGDGVYIVNGLELPEFVTLRGVAQQGQKNANEGSTIIKLADGLNNTHVITVTNEAQIINLQIDGNKANTTGTSYGIYFNRPGIYIESVVDGVSVVNTRSAGIYVNGNEVTIRRTSVLESDGYGIYVAGPAWDTIIQTVLLGWNGSDGLYLGSGSGFVRIENVDSYFSRGNGMTFVDPFYVNFYRPQIDYSFGHGLEIVVNSSSTQLDVYAPMIHDSNFLDDGRGRTNSAASGTYSEVCISGTNYPSSLKFHNGRFAPLSTRTVKPLYALCWSNTIPTVGYGTYLNNIIVETASGVRTASGKSAADGWLNGYWSGLLPSYYDGTNVFSFERNINMSSRWAGLLPINAPTTMNGALTLGSTLSASGSITAGGVAATRDLNSSKLGIKIQADTGETFGISNFGDSLYIASDSDSTPSLRFNGPAGTFQFIGAASFNDSVTASTFVSAGTSVSVGTTLELGHATDTTLSRQSAGVVALESVPVIDAAVGTLTYSGTTVNITAGKGVAQEDTLTCTNSFSLTFSSLNNKDAGYVTIWPAATNCTITLPSYAFGLGSRTLTITGGTGNTNYSVLTWFNTVVGGTNRVSVNIGNYF